MSPAGRRPGGADTRAEILAAARAEFGERGYTAATVRQVARRARVDPALVYHYFADKAGLFVACLNLPADPREVQIQARGGELDGARIAERFLAQWEEGATEPGKSFVTLVQAVSSAPEVARAVREFLTERVWARVRTGDGEAVARATCAGVLPASRRGLGSLRDPHGAVGVGEQVRGGRLDRAHHRGVHHRPARQPGR